MPVVNRTDIDGLLQWAGRNHSTLSPAVEIYEDDLTGLSFRAAKDILEGECFVDCAYETTLSYLNAINGSSTFSRHNSDPFPAAFIDHLSKNDPHVIGYFFLIQQFLLKDKSFWWNYIKLLPQPNEPQRLSVPALWPAHDQRFLDGTNAEPAIEKRMQLWEEEWTHGRALLRDRFQGWENYSLFLYQWAAAIFGSRSFRPSLTLSPQLLHHQQHSPGNLALTLSHVSDDSFSILLPVLDIGNHNGSDVVSWECSSSFRLLSRGKILKGCQIYNYYGHKSNSELLIAYGFMLPQNDNDRVNLKLKLTTEIQSLRRSQASHVFPNRNQPGEEFMFNIGVNASQLTLPLSCFSSGLFDTTMCVVANTRERHWILKNLQYWPEKDTAVFQGPLARSAFQALGVLKTKLELELARLQQLRLGEAKNQNQVLALKYRRRQEDVLDRALPIISQQITSAKLLSLDSAFGWIKAHYPAVSTKVEALISEDQEEPLPLNWDVLAEDWDHTYLTVWTYIILSLVEEDPTNFQKTHPTLYNWIFDLQITDGNIADQLFAEESEVDTIHLMVNLVSKLFSHGDVQKRKMRNLASFIVKEEAVRGHKCRFSDKKVVVQDMLCINI